MKPIERFRKYRRKKVKKAGRRLLQRYSHVMAGQSLIGDQPVFEASVFPWTGELENNWLKIRNELDSVLEKRHELPSFHELSRGQKRISQGDNWKTFVFYILGDRYEPNCRRCPETARILEQIPNLRNAWYSILSPHYHIPPHQGPSKGVIRVHLGLRVPKQADQCRLRVAEHILHWEEGKCLVFDDYYEHEVWNDTDQVRAVLFLDVDRPMRPLGRFINKTLIAISKQTVFIKETHNNLDQWEQRYNTSDSGDKYTN